jgi:TatD DNase family protein
MIDSHCHLDAAALVPDRAAVLLRASSAGVTDIVVPAVDEASWGAIRALCDETRAPRCHATVGLHPCALPFLAPDDDDALLSRLGATAQRGGIVAIGECGLDATIDLARAPWSRQERFVRQQLALARSLDLPVILHGRGGEAYTRLADLLDEGLLGPRGAVIHSYGGGAELLRRFLHHPLMFGFCGPATWPKARKIAAAIAAVPEDRLLAETDAPDQTPEPHRPGRNEPAYLAGVVEGIARIRGFSSSRAAALTIVNSKRLFGIGAEPTT